MSGERLSPETADIADRLEREQRQFDRPTVFGDAAAEIRRLRTALAETRGERPAGFWSQREWEDWSNDLATLIPEDDVSAYSNPEGAQEGIISDCLAAYIAEREVG